MLYFVTIKNVLYIQDWQQDMSNNPAFEALNEEQRKYRNDYPEASALEVKNLSPRTAAQPEQQVQQKDIETLRQEAVNDISAYSLAIINKHVSTYQYANADASLKVADGDGIYTHEKAQKVIDTYNRLGKLCREKYYSAKARIDEAEDEQTINDIKQEAYDYYDNIGKLL